MLGSGVDRVGKPGRKERAVVLLVQKSCKSGRWAVEKAELNTTAAGTSVAL